MYPIGLWLLIVFRWWLYNLRLEIWVMIVLLTIERFKFVLRPQVPFLRGLTVCVACYRSGFKSRPQQNLFLQNRQWRFHCGNLSVWMLRALGDDLKNGGVTHLRTMCGQWTKMPAISLLQSLPTMATSPYEWKFSRGTHNRLKASCLARSVYTKVTTFRLE